MVNTYAARIVSDPRKTARLYHLLEPFLPGSVCFLNNQGMFEAKLDEARKFAANPRIVSGIVPYRLMHERMREWMGSLQGEQFFFTTGVSVDQTGEGKAIGYDPFSSRNRLYEEIALVTRKTGQCSFIPVSPFFTPVSVHYPVVTHLMPSSVEHANRKMHERSRKLLGGPSRDVTDIMPKLGFWQFSSCLYDHELALKSTEPWESESQELYEKRIRECVNFNQHITAMAFANILWMAGINGEIDLYASKTSYAARIMDLASRYSGSFSVADWPILKDVEMPHEREVNRTALNRLKNRINARKDVKDKKGLEDLL